MGYTTGPWEYKKNEERRQTSPLTASFFPFGNGRADGEWKVVLDGGIDNPAPIEQTTAGRDYA